MLFNSLCFGVFVVVAVGLYHLFVGWTARKLVLLGLSYAFYAAWNPFFVLLLVFSTLVDWFAARAIDRSSSHGRRWLYAAGSVCVNLGLLGYYKYYGFFADNLDALGAMVGVDLGVPHRSIVLPVGISFYTFQTMSYTIDVYRGRLRPTFSFLDFALYVTFFPQLVAGPIVRATDFLPQCTEPKPFRLDEIGWGLQLLLFGLFQKVVIADRVLAPVTDAVFAAPDVDCLSAWTGCVAFAGQAYGDFAGYSTCAIGLAVAFGFHLPLNFRYPFAGLGISDVWRRWHVSLGSWLRDYLYVPLGGNRVPRWRMHVNRALTMLASGFWHGAAWTFVIWGALHAAYMVFEHHLARSRMGTWSIWRTAPGRGVLMAGTFALFCYSLAFFRATSLAGAVEVATAMLSPTLPASPALNRAQILIVLVTMSLVVGHHWIMRDRVPSAWIARCPAVLLATLDTAMILAIVLVPGGDRAFVYFQF